MSIGKIPIIEKPMNQPTNVTNIANFDASLWAYLHNRDVVKAQMINHSVIETI